MVRMIKKNVLVGDVMHSKQTVKYICHQYPTGHCYYYKTEIITHDTWDNIQSLAWSRLRPISEKTFYKRKKEGFKVEYIKKQSAKIIDLKILKNRRKIIDE